MDLDQKFWKMDVESYARHAKNLKKFGHLNIGLIDIWSFSNETIRLRYPNHKKVFDDIDKEINEE